MKQNFMGGTSDRIEQDHSLQGGERGREEKRGRGGEYLRTLESHKPPYWTTPVS